MACRGDMEGKFVWFLVGIGIGASVALLYAPRTGRDTRRYLSRRAEEAGDYITEQGQEILDRGGEFLKEVAALVERGRKLTRA